MTKLVIFWNNIFAPRQWEPYADAGGSWVMKRWHAGAWETRHATAEESADASTWWAHFSI